MRTRRTRAKKNRAKLRDRCGSVLRFVTATFVALALSFMSISMASGAGMPHAAPAERTVTGHCADQNDTSADKRINAMNCAIACVVVHSKAFEMESRAIPVRSTPSPQFSPCLEGIVPEATSPPPRRLPEV